MPLEQVSQHVVVTTDPSQDNPADQESIWGAQVDLFASHESSHCQLYYSLTEAPLGMGALAHSWPQALRKYAFPPVSLLAKTLCKVREDEEQVLLVAPYWPTRTWFSELMLLVTAPPWGIPFFFRGSAPLALASRSRLRGRPN